MDTTTLLLAICKHFFRDMKKETFPVPLSCPYEPVVCCWIVDFLVQDSGQISVTGCYFTCYFKEKTCMAWFQIPNPENKKLTHHNEKEEAVFSQDIKIICDIQIINDGI